MIEITVLLQVNSFVFVFKKDFRCLLILAKVFYYFIYYCLWLFLLNFRFWLSLSIVIVFFIIIFIVFVFVLFFKFSTFFIIELDISCVVHYYRSFINNAKLFERLIITFWWDWNIFIFILVRYKTDVFIASAIKSSPKGSIFDHSFFKVVFWIDR